MIVGRLIELDFSFSTSEVSNGNPIVDPCAYSDPLPTMYKVHNMLHCP